MHVPESTSLTKPAQWQSHSKATQKRSLWLFLLSHPSGALGVCSLIVFALFAYLAPGDKLLDTLRTVTQQSPCAAHWLGCDAAGRDLAARIIHSAALSLELGATVACIDIVIGAIWGSIAAYTSGRLNRSLVRCADFLQALPLIFMVVLIRHTFKPGWLSLLIALSVFGWFSMARMVHKGIAKRFQQEMITPTLGTSKNFLGRFWSLMQGPILVTFCMTIPEVICIEATLSFLRLGVQPPYFTLGSLASEGLLDIRYFPWHFFAPAFVLLWLVLSLHLVAEAIQSFFDEGEEAKTEKA